MTKGPCIGLTCSSTGTSVAPMPPVPPQKDVKEVYLVIVGETPTDAKFVVYSEEGAKLFDEQQTKKLISGEGLLRTPKYPKGKYFKLVIKDHGLPSVELFILKGIIQEPTEIDALCHLSNMLGPGT